jgi:hypothetical protein
MAMIYAVEIIFLAGKKRRREECGKKKMFIETSYTVLPLLPKLVAFRIQKIRIFGKTRKRKNAGFYDGYDAKHNFIITICAICILFLILKTTA